MNKLDSLAYYRKFTDQRNRALEQILRKYKLMISDEVRGAFYVIAHTFITGQKASALTYIVQDSGAAVEHLVNEMRRTVHALTVTSEGEVLARIYDRPNQQIHSDKNYQDPDLEAGGSVSRRVVYYLNNIIRKLEALSELAQVKGEKLTAEEVSGHFPRMTTVKKRPVLTRIKESDGSAKRSAKPNMSIEFVSPERWDKVLSDYMDDYVPHNRGPDFFYSDAEMTGAGRFPAGRYEDKTYQWELEQDVTHDFVQSVREGQLEAFEQNGITDFVWIAIVDDKTDECCLWRDGLTSQEIEAQLKTSHKDDECQTIVPPAHFNCRCSLEPSTENMPDKPVSNRGDFDEWLET